MLKKASAAMRNDYGTIAALVQENKRTHIIYITKNEEGDFVVMSIMMAVHFKGKQKTE